MPPFDPPAGRGAAGRSGTLFAPAALAASHLWTSFSRLPVFPNRLLSARLLTPLAVQLLQFAIPAPPGGGRVAARRSGGPVYPCACGRGPPPAAGVLPPSGALPPRIFSTGTCSPRLSTCPSTRTSSPTPLHSSAVGPRATSAMARDNRSPQRYSGLPLCRAGTSFSSRRKGGKRRFSAARGDGLARFPRRPSKRGRVSCPWPPIPATLPVRKGAGLSGWP